MKKIILATALFTTISVVHAFDLNDFVESATQKIAKSTSNKESSLSSSIITDGLKEALKIGVDYGIKELSKDGGYLNNKEVKIPLPQNLKKLETVIRGAGGDKITDNFINSMNKAATQAAPKTVGIFLESINNMSISDAKKILAGDNNAATKYFETKTSDNLKKMILPIIQKTMDENNVAVYYEKFNEYYKSYGQDIVKSSGAIDIAKSFGVDSYIPKASDEKLDDYVTNKALDGLFKMIAKKELEIRNNPVSQTTSLLKKVFSK